MKIGRFMPKYKTDTNFQRTNVFKSGVSTNSTTRASCFDDNHQRKKSRQSMLIRFALFLSERRDSNPRPRPWQGRALPAELLSLTHPFMG